MAGNGSILRGWTLEDTNWLWSPQNAHQCSFRTSQKLLFVSMDDGCTSRTLKLSKTHTCWSKCVRVCLYWIHVASFSLFQQQCFNWAVGTSGNGNPSWSQKIVMFSRMPVMPSGRERRHSENKQTKHWHVSKSQGDKNTGYKRTSQSSCNNSYWIILLLEASWLILLDAYEIILNRIEPSKYQPEKVHKRHSFCACFDQGFSGC